MKVIMVSRVFPAYHPRKGQPTHFVEQILNTINTECYWANFHEWNSHLPLQLLSDYRRRGIRDDITGKKVHTIRNGDRWKQGDHASIRVWSGDPYKSKQITVAKVEIIQTIPVNISRYDEGLRVMIDGNIHNNRELLAKNDGLQLEDFAAWFAIHPKTKGQVFDGQIICWSDVKY